VCWLGLEAAGRLLSFLDRALVYLPVPLNVCPAKRCINVVQNLLNILNSAGTPWQAAGIMQVVRNSLGSVVFSRQGTLGRVARGGKRN
jgi:hypothetical protein